MVESGGVWYAGGFRFALEKNKNKLIQSDNNQSIQPQLE